MGPVGSKVNSTLDALGAYSRGISKNSPAQVKDAYSNTYSNETKNFIGQTPLFRTYDQSIDGRTVNIKFNNDAVSRGKQALNIVFLGTAVIVGGALATAALVVALPALPVVLLKNAYDKSQTKLQQTKAQAKSEPAAASSSKPSENSHAPSKDEVLGLQKDIREAKSFEAIVDLHKNNPLFAEHLEGGHTQESYKYVAAVVDLKTQSDPVKLKQAIETINKQMEVINISKDAKSELQAGLKEINDSISDAGVVPKTIHETIKNKFALAEKDILKGFAGNAIVTETVTNNITRHREAQQKDMTRVADKMGDIMTSHNPHGTEIAALETGKQILELHEKEPMFAKYVRGRTASESINFMKAISILQTMPPGDQKNEYVRNIGNEFIGSKAPQEINITSTPELRKLATELKENDNKNLTSEILITLHEHIVNTFSQDVMTPKSEVVKAYLNVYEERHMENSPPRIHPEPSKSESIAPTPIEGKSTAPAPAEGKAGAAKPKIDLDEAFNEKPMFEQAPTKAPTGRINLDKVAPGGDDFF